MIRIGTYPSDYINLKYSNYHKYNPYDAVTALYGDKMKILRKQKRYIRREIKSVLGTKTTKEAVSLVDGMSRHMETIFAEAFSGQDTFASRKSSSAVKFGDSDYSIQSIGMLKNLIATLGNDFASHIKTFQNALQTALNVICEDIGYLNQNLQVTILNELYEQNNLLKGDPASKYKIIETILGKRNNRGPFFLTKNFQAANQDITLAIAQIVALIDALDSLNDFGGKSFQADTSKGMKMVSSDSEILQRLSGVIGGSLTSLSGAAEEIAEYSVMAVGIGEVIGGLKLIDATLSADKNVINSKNSQLAQILHSYGGDTAMNVIKGKSDINLRVSNNKVEAEIGVSIKKTTPKDTKTVSVSIRNDTPLIRAIWEAGLYENSFLNAFLNLSLGQADEDFPEASLSALWRQAIDSIGYGSVFQALTGADQVGPSALIMVINRKVFSMEKIISLMSATGNSKIGLDIKPLGTRFPDLNKKIENSGTSNYKTGIGRSEMLQEIGMRQLYKIKLNYSLLLSGSKINL